MLKRLGVPIWNPAKITGEQLAMLRSGKIKRVINLQDIFKLEFDYPQKAELLSLFKAGTVRFLTPPGFEFLGNKALVSYVDQFIDLYLNETPLIPGQPTEWITSAEDIGKPHEGWVIKKSDGLQGQQVFLTDHLLATGNQNLKKLLLEWFSFHQILGGDVDVPVFVRQKFVEPSYVPVGAQDSWVRFNVDFRPLISIQNGVPLANPPVWGRGNMKMAHNLNNVSRGAMETVVTTVELCQERLTTVSSLLPQ